MAVDACFQPLLSDPRSELRPPPPHVSLAKLRAGNRGWLIGAPRVDLHSVDNINVPGPRGELGLRVYRPHSHVIPSIVYCHGGGFVLGDLDTHDSICSRLALYSGAAVVSVDYGLAPESRFPGPVNDCYAALLAIYRQASQLKLDPTRLAIAGDSAGANLAAATFLTAAAGGPRLKYAALLYPMVDPTCNFPSMREFSSGYLLSAAAVRWFWEQYLASTSDRDPRSQLLNASFAGLAPISISTAQYDPLRDEGHALAEHARSAGVAVRYRCYAGMVHGFAGLPQLTPMADRAIRELSADLHEALS